MKQKAHFNRKFARKEMRKEAKRGSMRRLWHEFQLKRYTIKEWTKLNNACSRRKSLQYDK